jgi:hypothetical protein
MGEVFLDKTISLLSSDKQKARSDGLAGCFSILSHCRKNDANSISRLEAHIPAEQEELQAVSSQLPPNRPAGYQN